MSNYTAVLQRATSESQPSAPPTLLPHDGQYAEIGRLLKSEPVLAVVDSGAGCRATEVCRGIAREIAANGRRVAIVQITRLLNIAELPDGSACAPTATPGILHWPGAADVNLPFFPEPAATPVAPPAPDWLESLRRRFDVVLLSCPAIAAVPSAAAIAALAQNAVLVVEAGKTTKTQIRQDQQALSVRGVKLTGSILMQQR